MMGWKDNAKSGAFPSGDRRCSEQIKRMGRAEPSPTNLTTDLLWPAERKKERKKEKSIKTTLEGKFQLPDLGTTSPFMLTEQQTEEKQRISSKQNKKRQRFVESSNNVRIKTFVSNRAKKI